MERMYEDIELKGVNSNMQKRTPEFRFLQAFEAAGRLGSFKNAAA